WSVGCGENGKGLVSPGDDLSPASAFPDSVTRSMGLPPSVVIPRDTTIPPDPHAPGDFSGLIAHATSETIDAGPRILRATMWVVNPGTEPVNVTFGACSGGVQLLVPGRSAPAWQSSSAKDPRYDQPPACIMVAYVRRIAARDSLAFVTQYPMYEVVNDT